MTRTKAEKKAVALVTEHLMQQHYGRDLEEMRGDPGFEAALKTAEDAYREAARLQVASLRPVLKSVWDDGYGTGRDDEEQGIDKHDANPYTKED